MPVSVTTVAGTGGGGGEQVAQPPYLLAAAGEVGGVGRQLPRYVGAGRFGGGVRRGAQHLPVRLRQLPSRVDAEAVDQPFAGVAEGRERRVTATECLVEPNERGLGPLVERVGPRGLLGEGDYVRRTAQCQGGFGVPADGCPASFYRRRHGGMLCQQWDVGDRIRLPLRERLPEPGEGTLLSPAALGVAPALGQRPEPV